MTQIGVADLFAVFVWIPSEVRFYQAVSTAAEFLKRV